MITQIINSITQIRASKEKICVISILALISLIFFIFPSIQAHSNELPKLTVFYSPSCHKCIEAKNEILPEIENEFKRKILFEYRDIADMENYKLLLSLKEKHGSKIDIVLPVFYLQGNFLNAQGEIKNALREFIAGSLKKAPSLERCLPAIDLLTRFKSFKPFAIIAAGLTDGINPCAFTVLVFFISFLSLQGYKKRELIIIGMAFIFAVFLTYLAIGLGLFGFLYQLKGFWLVTKIFNLAVGVLSIALGLFALYDFFKFKKTGQTEGLLLQLPKGIKNRIHSVIGMHYRKSKEREVPEVTLRIFKLSLNAFVTGALVSILEAICTGQVYLPTITFVLKTAPFKLQALGYLLLYNFMFIIPLFIIFVFALLGTTSEQFSRILKRHLLSIKLLMAILFFALGIFLIWRA